MTFSVRFISTETTSLIYKIMETYISNISSLKIDSDIAFVTIQNGAKNLLTTPEFFDIDMLEDLLYSNQQVKAVIISGSGKHFSHGADVNSFSSETNEDLLTEKLENAKELLRFIEKLPIVTVAAINGGCFGGGLEIALSCQFRICAYNAFLGLPEIMHGVIPGMGGIERLTRLVGKSKAISMILSGEIMSADDALNNNIVHKISDQKDCLPDAIKFTREMINGKSNEQINAIINVVNRTLENMDDPSGGEFEKILVSRMGNR